MLIRMNYQIQEITPFNKMFDYDISIFMPAIDLNLINLLHLLMVYTIYYE